MTLHTHMGFAFAAIAGKPGCYRFWEQLGLMGVCMPESEM